MVTYASGWPKDSVDSISKSCLRFDYICCLNSFHYSSITHIDDILHSSRSAEYICSDTCFGNHLDPSLLPNLGLKAGHMASTFVGFHAHMHTRRWGRLRRRLRRATRALLQLCVVFLLTILQKFASPHCMPWRSWLRPAIVAR